MKVIRSVERALDVSLVAAGVGMWLAWFGPLFQRLGSVILSPEGDGLKNTFTFVWQVVHGDSYTEFSGMNAPFGEHICYTDGHPWLAALMQATGPWSTEQALAVLNGFTLLSVPLSALAFFMLFRTFGERRLARALPAAIALSFMQPAVMRLGGHYALNHVWMFVGCWALLRVARSLARPQGAFIALFLLQSLAWFTHAYLGAMSSGFVLLVSGFEAAHRRTWRFAVPAWISLCSVALFRGFIAVTDRHEGRIEHPTGFWRGHGELQDWVVPVVGPMRSLVDGLGRVSLTWEASAYIGVGTMAVLVGLAVRRRGAGVGQYEVLAAMALGLVALGLPWRWVPEALEALPVFKQFRAVGRFAWPLAAVAGVAAFGAVRNRPWLLRLLVVSWLVEGGAVLRMASTWSAPSPFLDQTLPVPPDVHAILPLPFTHYGSEAHSLPRREEAMRVATVVAQATGIPMMAANLTRVAVPEARAQLAQFGRPGGTRFGLPLDAPVWVVRSSEPLRDHEARRFLDRPDSVRTPLPVEGCTDAYRWEPARWDSREWVEGPEIWSEEFEGLPGGCWSGSPQGQIPIARIPCDSLPPGRYAVSTWWSTTEPGGFNNRFAWQLMRGKRKVAWAFPEEAVTFNAAWCESVTEFDHRNGVQPGLDLVLAAGPHHNAELHLHRITLRRVSPKPPPDRTLPLTPWR